MDLQQELGNLAETLKRQRDEISLQIHLAGMEARKEWENSEQQWQQFKEQLDEVRDETKDITEELAGATKVIGEELNNAYRRIVERLKD